MDREIKTAYESPVVDVVEIQVEKGFATTNPTGTIDPWG